MGIIARYSHKGDGHLLTPGRIYLHRTGSEVFNGDGMSSPIKNAALYAQNVLKVRLCTMRDYAYFLGVLWGEGREKVLDLFGYEIMEPSSAKEAWQKSNPDVDLWVIRGGEWISENRTCEDTTIILGREGEHRRRTAGLAEFINTFPDLGSLEPADERYENLKLWALPQQV